MKKAALVAAMLTFTAAGALNAHAGDLKIGATPVPHAELLELIRPALREQGVNLEVVEFNDYVQPNLATASGSLQANFFQHRPYLDSFVSEHGVDLLAVADIHIEPMGMYSRKFSRLEDLPSGARIAIPNDPTNGGRALLLLARHGVIGLRNPDDIKTTVLDVTANERRLSFVELEAALLPRTLDDVDASIINTNFAMAAGLSPLKDAIIIEDSTSPYVNVVVTTSAQKDSEDLHKVIEALRSEQVRSYITDKYQGAVVPVF